MDPHICCCLHPGSWGDSTTASIAGLPLLLACLRVASVLPDTVLSEVGVSAVAGVLAVAAILIASGDYLFEVL
jgi:hypothetical protein